VVETDDEGDIVFVGHGRNTGLSVGSGADQVACSPSGLMIAKLNGTEGTLRGNAHCYELGLGYGNCSTRFSVASAKDNGDLISPRRAASTAVLTTFRALPPNSFASTRTTVRRTGTKCCTLGSIGVDWP